MKTKYHKLIDKILLIILGFIIGVYCMSIIFMMIKNQEVKQGWFRHNNIIYEVIEYDRLEIP